MNTDFAVGCLLVWVVIAVLLVLGRYQSVADGVMPDKKELSWGAVLLDAFTWPLQLAHYLVQVALSYWYDYQDYRAARKAKSTKQTKEIPYGSD